MRTPRSSPRRRLGLGRQGGKMEKSLSFRGVEGVRAFNEFGGIAAACHDRRAISFPLFRSVNLVHRRRVRTSISKTWIMAV
jgi:hypothetical protein